MMKAFGSCPPEYRIMAVWSFIFLTLLYMILLICVGTGERKKKAMLQDSLLLIAAFLITSGLCVQQGFYGEKDFMVFLKMPYGILIIMWICGFLFAGIQAFGIYKRRTNCLRENAIQESLDNLPSGIGFFDRNGMPKLMNRKMYQLCRNLAGRDIQNITELREALRRPLKDHVFYDFDLKVYCFSDGSVWKFSEKEIITAGGDRFSQFLASEVSEFDTLDELKTDIKAKIKEQKVNDGKRAQEDAAVDAIIESAKMDLPEAMVDTQARQMLDEFAQRMQQQGLTLDQYMQFTGMTADKMMDELRPQAEKRIKTRLVLEAIAAAEGITASEEEVEKEFANIAERYGLTVDKVKEIFADEETENIKSDIAAQKALDMITEAAVEVPVTEVEATVEDAE